MVEVSFQLAQFRLPFDAGDLIYVAIVALTVLGGIGKSIVDQIKKRQDQKSGPKPPAPSLSQPPARSQSSVPAPTAGPARKIDASEAQVILAELFDLPGKRRSPSPGAAPSQGVPQRPPSPRPLAAGPSQPGRLAPKASRPKNRKGKRPQAPGAQRASGQGQVSAKPPAKPTAPPQRPPGKVEPASPTEAAVRVAKTAEGLSVQELRRAIILTEVLAPPVALRGPRHPW